MIRRSLVVALVMAGLGLYGARSAWAQDGPSDDAGTVLPGADDEGGDDETQDGEDPLSRHRLQLDVITDRMIGVASQPVAFNWRKRRAMVAGFGSYYLELNTFNSGRAGAMVRVPTGGAILEIGASYAMVGDSEASRTLALTPYRQPGRPSRIEVDLNVGLPLAEGVVTAQPRIVPSVQMVLMGYAGFRYRLYPTGWSGLRTGQVARAVLSPTLSEREQENLEGVRRSAMALDPERYGLVAGIGNDLYFKQGIFLSPRLLFGVPLLAPATNTRLLFWVDASLAVGVAF